MKKLLNERYDRHFSECKDLVYRVALNYMSDREEAEDVMQEVFLKFYIHFDEVDEDIVKPWLVVATKRTSIDHLRKRRITPVSALPYSLPESVDNGIGDLTDRMARRDLTKSIFKDVHKVNIEWYDLLTMDCFYRVKQEDIAKVKNISVDALRSKLYRAKQYIRSTYGEYYKELV